MTVRRLKKTEAQAAIELSDIVFREPGQSSMGQAFPYIFSEAFIENSYGYFVNDELVVFMGLVPSTIIVGNSRVQVYSLGSVCTHPDYRGKGYASEVLDIILSDLKQTEASLLLISGGRSLYTRVGSRTFGKVESFEIVGKPHEQDNIDNLNIREANNNDIHSLSRLASTRTVRYEQSVQELDLLIKSEAYASCNREEHRVLVVEKDEDIQAFLVIGVPSSKEKTSGTAIEWGGSPSLVKRAFKHAVKKYELEHLRVGVPWHEQQLIAELEEYRSTTEQNQGTMILLDPEKLLQQLKPYYKTKNIDIKYTSLGDGGCIKLLVNNQEKQLTKEELIAFIFTPEERESEFEALKVSLPYTAGLNYV